MGFIGNCFIRKNTKYLRNFLEESGYVNLANPKFDFTSFRTVNLEGEGYLRCSDGILDILKEKDVNSVMSVDETLIDCGNSEMLFKILALQQDEPLHGCFWWNDILLMCISDSSWDLNLNSSPTYRFSCVGNPEISSFPVSLEYTKRATIKEIVEYFKDRNLC